MEPESIPPKETLESAVSDEKTPPTTAAANNAMTEEEKAQRDAKLRPEREAGFGDYVVSISRIMNDADVSNAKIEDLLICEALGFRTLWNGIGGSLGIRCRMSNPYTKT